MRPLALLRKTPPSLFSCWMLSAVRLAQTVCSGTFIDVVGVDVVLSLHQRTVLLRLTVEQEAVLQACLLVGLEHSHVALGALKDTNIQWRKDKREVQLWWTGDISKHLDASLPTHLA